MQRLMCTAFNDHPHDPDASLWTGYWPGVVECHWMKWFTPDGQHDLNRLALLHARGHE